MHCIWEQTHTHTHSKTNKLILTRIFPLPTLTVLLWWVNNNLVWYYWTLIKPEGKAALLTMNIFALYSSLFNQRQCTWKEIRNFLLVLVLTSSGHLSFLAASCLPVPHPKSSAISFFLSVEAPSSHRCRTPCYALSCYLLWSSRNVLWTVKIHVYNTLHLRGGEQIITEFCFLGELIC